MAKGATVPDQTLTLGDDADLMKMAVRLNGTQNVVLRFEQENVTPEPFIWGLTIEEFREYLGMLNTFNKTLAKVKRA